LAEARFGDVAYSFKRNGMWKPFLTVRVEGTPYDIARMEMHWLKDSQLKMQDGTVYTWALTSMWRQEFTFSAAHGTKPVVFRSKMTMKGLEAEVVVEKSFQLHRDAPMLVLLGWYLIASISSSDGADTAVLMAAIS
jgi:hypothetical protein